MAAPAIVVRCIRLLDERICTTSASAWPKWTSGEAHIRSGQAFLIKEPPKHLNTGPGLGSWSDPDLSNNMRRAFGREAKLGI